VASGIAAAFTTTNEEGKNAVQDAITSAISNAFVGLSTQNIGEQTIPEVLAHITTLRITGVDNPVFGSINGMIKSLLGGSDLTIPSATAKISNLQITGAEHFDLSQITSVGEQIVALLQAALDAHPLVPTINTSGITGGSEDNHESEHDTGNHGTRSQ